MTVLLILAGAALFYLLICLAAYLGQRQLIYHPISAMAGDPSDFELNISADTLRAADGSEFLLWRVGESDSVETLIIYFHGNAENVSHNIDRYMLFNSLRAAVWAVEYRGYAGVGSNPTEAGLELDLDALAEHLRQRFGDGAGGLRIRVVAYGRSLGGGVAAKLAERIELSGLVLESTFTSLHDAAGAAFPFLPSGLLLRERYNTAAIVARLDCPKLIMHSPDDGLMPYEIGRKLFAVAAEPKRFIDLPGSHNARLEIARGTLEPALRSFLQSLPEA